MRILVFPRDDPNPYQRLLYGEMGRLGVQADYLGRLTPSRTLNLLLLPAELAAWRLRGARVVHLHWVHGFAVAGADRFPVLRRAAQAWFGVFLTVTRLLGLRLVWTAHNVLPHETVFADDVATRRRLVAACDLVIVHSQAALADIAALGAVPSRTSVIPHGPFAPLTSARSGPVPVPGAGDGPRRLLFFGRVHDYKGVPDLLAAFTALPAGLQAELTIAGECPDPGLRRELQVAAVAAAQSGRQIALRLERVCDEDVTRLMAWADAVVLPFRRVTTSGSAMLALCHGRPIVVPDLAAFADLPDKCVIRYDKRPAGLADALAVVAQADSSALAAMSAAAIAYASALTWPDVAAVTVAAMTAALGARSADPSADGLPAAR